MPCSAPARGKLGAAEPPPGQHDPCSLPIVTSIGGTDVSAESLCVFHMTLKRGFAAMTPPVLKA